MTQERNIDVINKELAECREELRNVKGKETEVYTRIVGYYRSVKNWNKGKKSEFKQRVCFDPENKEAEAPADENAPASFVCFTKKTCPNCPAVKDFIASTGMDGIFCSVDDKEGLDKARGSNIFAVPTVIFYNADGKELSRAYNIKDIKEKLGIAEAAVV